MKCQQIAHDDVDIESVSSDARAHYAHRIAHGLESHLLLFVSDDQPPHAVVARWNHAAKGYIAADESLELERDVLEDMG